MHQELLISNIENTQAFLSIPPKICLSLTILRRVSDWQMNEKLKASSSYSQPVNFINNTSLSCPFLPSLFSFLTPLLSSLCNPHSSSVFA